MNRLSEWGLALATLVIMAPCWVTWRVTRPVSVAHSAPAVVEKKTALPPAPADEPTPARRVVSFSPHGQGREQLQQHCGACHMDGEKKGGFSFDEWPSEPEAAVEAWRRIQQQVYLGIMPPITKPALSDDQRAQLLGWIDTEIFRPLEDPHDPGPSGWRRLSRVEYARTLQSLLGGEPIALEALPADDAAEGFDTIGAAQTLSPLHLEKYLAVTSRVLRAALAPPVVTSQVVPLPIAQWTGGERTDDGRLVRTANGDLQTRFTLTADGEYELQFQLHERPAGPEAARVSLWLDGSFNGTFHVAGELRAPQMIQHRFTGYQGQRQVVLRFENDAQDPTAANPLRRDRDLVLVSAQLVGPTAGLTPLRPPWYAQLFPTPAWSQADRSAQRTLAQAWLSDFSTRAWRRKVTAAEITELLRLYDDERQATDFTEAMLTAYQAVLVSPHFIFREIPPSTVTASAAAEWKSQPLSDEALAVRMAYLMWSAPPDQALRQLAAQSPGTLRLSEELPRLLAHPQAVAFQREFLGRWLQLDNLTHKPLQPAGFPEFDAALRQSMQQETEIFLRGLLAGEWPVTALLTADFTHVDARLAQHYGLPGDFSSAFQRVSLSTTPRRGLLGHAGLLTLTSHPDRTSPTTRGKWILETLLGAPPPPAPQNVPPLEDATTRDFHGTLAEKLALHRRDPSCAGCHRSMDPLGLILEPFDALGRERAEPTPPEAALLGQPITSLPDLSEKLAQHYRTEFLHHFTRQLLIYGCGRSLRPSDEAAVRLIVSQAEAAGGRLSDYLIATVRSVPFSQQRVPRY
jgi:mono/diheme cytochrome c family protein